MLEESYRKLNENTYGLTQLLTQEEKTSLRAFAQKVHIMPERDVMKLNCNMADDLTSEMKDIVAYEVKLREVKILKANNIDPDKAFTVENGYKNPEYTKELSRQDLEKQQSVEKQRMAGMTIDLLQKTRETIENTYLPVDKEKLNKRNGGGINALWRNYIIEDDNGKTVKVKNGKIQELFRKRYIKALSEVTGIDYTALDQTPDEYIDEPIGGYSVKSGELQNGQSYQNKRHPDPINLDDYDDDDDD